MPVFKLTEEIIFPPVNLASEEGILAIGGDLSSKRLLEAYSKGIFPWFSENDPIIWWSPDPRFVIFPDSIKISKSMKQVLKKNTFKITYDRAFETVIKECSKPRAKEKETWITGEMVSAYINLHKIGYAHSVEAWQNDKIVGGLYGVSIGKCFFGESMFSKVSNASKAAFITCSLLLKNYGFSLIDCQVYTDHLLSLGAQEISRSKFINLLNEGLKHKSIIGNWGNVFNSYEKKN